MKPNRMDEMRKAMLAKYAGKETLTLEEQIEVLSLVNVTKLTGKLEEMYSVSSSPTANEACIARAKNPAMICHECFSVASLQFKRELRLALEYNTAVFSTWLFDDAALVTIPIPNIIGYDRIESHGDVRNTTHARNYVRLVRSHNWINFGVWSKNLAFYNTAFTLDGKPNNMTFIASSPFYNRVMFIPEKYKWFIDHVFTVYRKTYATENNIDINCGARDCKNCLKCYKKDTVFEINEMLKQDAMKKERRPVLIGKVNWTHNDDGTITLVFHDVTNDTKQTKHYKTEKGARAAETRFYNTINRNMVEKEIKNNM